MTTRVLLAGLLSACGATDAPVPDRRLSGVDAEIAPFVASFADVAGFAVVDVPANFDDLPTGHAGECLVDPEGRAEIRIDADFWLAFPAYREFLVWHELGHCLLGRSHSPNPQSIMWRYAAWSPELRDEYAAEISRSAGLTQGGVE